MRFKNAEVSVAGIVMFAVVGFEILT
ncbi:hypothetical protein METHPM2_40089 [Pseudomonas sp. PM2]